MSDRRDSKFWLKDPVDPYFTKKYGAGPLSIWIEDRDTEVFGGSWGDRRGNPACLLFAVRRAVGDVQLQRVTADEVVWYGKIKGLGELVCEDELGDEVVST